MTEPLPGFERPAAEQRAASRPEGRLVRVQPDITSIERGFVYEVPVAWDEDTRAAVDVGALVRMDFGGRRTSGWVTEVDVEFEPSVEVRPLTKWSSHGPPRQVIELAEWAAWRWAGRLPHLLRAASPRRMVTVRRPGPPATPDLGPLAHSRAFDEPTTHVRTTPGDTGIDLALAAATRGCALILVPTIAQRRDLVAALRSSGVSVAEYDDQWDRSAAGWTTVGTRTAAFAPMRDLDAVLVIDEHHSAYKEERTPSWNARDVAVERARRQGAPSVLSSPSPSLEGLRATSRHLVPVRSVERAAWPRVDVEDLREQDQPGLLTEGIVDLIRGEGPIACVLNRKGRARMLACARCASLAACTECGGALREDDDGRLLCPRDGTIRPMVCTECRGTHMKQLRLGISRLATDLRLLAKRDVIEVSADTPERILRGDELFVGTEALLHRLESARSVVFLDFDQELAVPRVRAAEDAFALVALAARRVGPRAGGGRIVIQTHRPHDIVVQATTKGDPDAFLIAQRDVRQVFSQPPYGAWALISGAGAAAFVESIDAEGVASNRLGEQWRVTAADHHTLLDAIQATDRPAERVRIDIDPRGI